MGHLTFRSVSPLSIQQASLRLPTVLLGALLFLSSPKAEAQSFYGSINGNVTDKTGAAIPGAQVTLRNTATNDAVKVVTDALGAYRFPNLIPGNYVVVVEEGGFSRLVRENITVEVQSAVRIDASLVPGQDMQTINVTAETPALESEDATLAQVIPAATVQETPLNGRNVMNLVTLAPGVVGQGGATGQGTSANVNGGGATATENWGNYQLGGGLANQNAVFYDSTPITASFYNAVVLVPTQDAVQEFRVSTSDVSADFGRFGGGVVNFTTRSGTKDFHGSLYEYLRNKIFNANSFFNNRAGTPRPQFNQNQYGVTAGGPIVKNKAFFFFSWENLNIALQTPGLFSVPTTAELNGDFSAPGLPKIYDPLTLCGFFGNPACPVVNGQTIYTRQQFMSNKIPQNRWDPATNVMKQFWAPPNLPGFVNNYSVNESIHDAQTQYNVRFDANPNAKQSLFGRYTFWTVSDAPPQRPFPFPDIAGSLFTTTQAVALGDTYVLNPTTVLDAHVSFLRFTDFLTAQSAGQQLSQFSPGQAALQNQISFAAFPSPVVSGLFSFVNDELFSNYTNNTYVLSGDVLKTLGRHYLKLGGEARRTEWYYEYDTTANGEYIFDNGFTAQNPLSPSGSGLGFASFLLGYPSSGFATEVAPASQYYFYNALYAQDTFHVNPRLTLNAGLRWDITPGMLAEKHGKAAVFLPSAQDPLSQVTGRSLSGQVALVNSAAYPVNTIHPNPWHLVAPRIGFSFQADPQTVVRGGYSIAYLPSTVNGPDAPWATPSNSSTTTMLATTNGGLTPANLLSNPFPNGLVEPTGRNAANLYAAVEGGSFVAPTPNVQYPYLQEFNLDVQRILPGTITFEIAYAGAKGTYLPIVGSPNLNQLPDQYDAMGAALLTQVSNPFSGHVSQSVGLLANSTIAAGQLLRPHPQFNSIINPALYEGNSTWNSLQVKAEKRFGHHGVLFGNYTWSKLLSNTDSLDLQSESPRVVGTPQDWTNLRGERSLDSFDVSQRGVISYVYHLPFGHEQRAAGGATGLVDHLVGGWVLSGTTLFQIGFPLAITAQATTLSNNFGAGTPRPNQVAGCNPKIAGSAVSRIGGWFNTACYTAPSTFGFGNEPRVDGRVRAEGIDNNDLALEKSTALREPVQLVFRAESFNLFNRVQLAAPGTAFGASTFGIVSNAQANNPRLLQFSLRLNY